LRGIPKLGIIVLVDSGRHNEPQRDVSGVYFFHCFPPWCLQDRLLSLIAATVHLPSRMKTLSWLLTKTYQRKAAGEKDR